MLMPTNSTDEGWPMHDANKYAEKLEGIAGVVDCTIFHGYQFTDVPNNGVHIVTTAAAGDIDLAERTGKKMASWIWEHRDEFILTLISAKDALAEAAAISVEERGGKPVVIHG